MSDDPTFIPDGYTRPGYIRRVPGLHGALRFTYRPLLPDERDALVRETGKRSAAEFGALTRKMLQKHVTEWDNKHEGQALPIDNETLRRLPPPMYTKLENIVSGYTPSDLEEAEQSPEAVDDFIASLEGDQSEADRKNS